MYSYGPPGKPRPPAPQAPGSGPAGSGPARGGAGGQARQGQGGGVQGGQQGERKAPPFSVTPSRQFGAWLKEQNASLAFTTYQAGKLFFIGTREGEKLTFFERSFPRAMGLHADADSVWISTLFQVWRMHNTLAPGRDYKGCDRLYVPQVGYTTGDIDIHDLALDKNGRPVFVNTLYGCLATVSDTHSFRPLWKPPWISRLAAEDRCHLNGLAVENGEAAYVTAASTADVVDAWRDYRKDGGVVCDVRTNEIVARGLSMPHSPRVHRGELWLLEAGSGYLGKVDRKTGAFERVSFCAGFARGLAFINDYAVVGTSGMREDRTFHGLELDANLKRHGIDARCALLVVDTRTGDQVHWMRFEGAVKELFDVAVIPGVLRPAALGFSNDEIRRTLSVEPSDI